MSLAPITGAVKSFSTLYFSAVCWKLSSCSGRISNTNIFGLLSLSFAPLYSNRLSLKKMLSNRTKTEEPNPTETQESPVLGLSNFRNAILTLAENSDLCNKNRIAKRIPKIPRYITTGKKSRVAQRINPLIQSPVSHQASTKNNPNTAMNEIDCLNFNFGTEESSFAKSDLRAYIGLRFRVVERLSQAETNGTTQASTNAQKNAFRSGINFGSKRNSLSAIFGI
ncbi:hypothetical protein LEP1GSC178_0865 [Leptospira licerasiae str. MMD4847]|uniref:DUF1564 family protein n=1 Tax=Leptospira licerasiae str. MMD4847 TaxID=1049971 RepID=A0ABN0H7E9_9LEPT|nr:hypothetical protein LEP1GSC178_0865 [Leptospira licerasiae str. MMD4847]